MNDRPPLGCRCRRMPSLRPICTTPDILHNVCAGCHHDAECHNRRTPRQEDLFS